MKKPDGNDLNPVRVLKVRQLVISIVFVPILLAAGCTDPVEKCVGAQVRVSEEREREAAERLKATGANIDWGKYSRETPEQVEARARLECLKAANGK